MATENKTNKPKGKVIAATVAPHIQAAVEDYRWPNKMTVSDLVGAAVVEYLTNRGVDLTPPAEDSAPEAKSDKAAAKA